MAASVELRVAERVAILWLANPPVQALTAALRRALVDALDRVDARPDVDAIVLTARGRVFSAGIDLREIEPRPPGQDAPGEDAPMVAALADRIAASRKPVVAVLPGPALGAGAELALAARWRLGTADARIGFPDVALGLVPGGGATQRLPRLIGLGRALDLLLTGATLDADGAMTLGLLDGLVTGDPASAGLSYVRAALSRPDAASHPASPGWADAATALRTATAEVGPDALVAERAPAEGGIVAACAAAWLLPPAQGRMVEAVRHADSLAHPVSRARRHMFLAERRVADGLLEDRGPEGRRPGPAGAPLVDRLGRAYAAAGSALLTRGATRQEVDEALVGWGCAVGPFGGESAGDHPPDPALVAQVIGALAAECEAMLADGAVAAPGDIDALAVHGLGLPRDSGGPMWLRSEGLLARGPVSPA